VTFGAKLKELRARILLSQSELAARTGLSIDAVKSYENGRRVPSLPVAQRLAIALHCGVSVFDGCTFPSDHAVTPPTAAKKKRGKKG